MSLCGQTSRTGAVIVLMASRRSAERRRVRHHRRSWLAPLLAGLLCSSLAVSVRAAVERYQSDEWITVCEPEPGTKTPGCSLTVPFGGVQNDKRGGFAMVVLLDSGMIGIVGLPFPVRAMVRIDKDPPIECHEWRYCLFPQDQSLAAIKELEVGSLILIDVYTARASFRFSLTPRGYQAGIAQIRAWGYRLP
jgi:hypothetical protein